MFGNNPIRSVIKNNNNLLSIQNIFLTIQGEGPFVGMPAIFVRLGGCNLACKFCDTEFESFQDLSYEEIFTQINKLKGQNATNLIVITGGEPMRQPIEVFCQMLLEKNFAVQIETNGTIFRNLPASVSIICSPKPHMNGYGLIRPDLLERLAAIKFIVSASSQKYSQIAEVGQSQFNIPVYIQPMDEYDTQKNAQNTSHAIALVQKHGYRLSLQTHKFIGIE